MTDTNSNEMPLGRDPDTVDPNTVEETIEQVGYFVIRLGESLYAFAEEQVAFVAASARPVRIPAAPDHFLGVVHLRGRIIAVADLAQVLGLESVQADRSTEEEHARRLVVLEAEEKGFAIIADTVLGQHSVRIDAVQASDKDTSAAGVFKRPGLIEGQFEHPQGVVMILRASALLRSLIGQDASSVPESGALV